MENARAVLANLVATSHMWLLGAWAVASVNGRAECFIEIWRAAMYLVATTQDSTHQMQAMPHLPIVPPADTSPLTVLVKWACPLKVKNWLSVPGLFTSDLLSWHLIPNTTHGPQ